LTAQQPGRSQGAKACMMVSKIIRAHHDDGLFSFALFG